MLNFDFCLPTRLVFGKDTHKQIGRLIRPYAKRVLLHYGGGSIKKSGLYDRVIQSLTDAGVSYVELGGVAPNPRISLVKEGVALCQKENVELILAVGGGSAIDSAKAIAIGLRNTERDLWDYFAKGLPIRSSAPVACILTLPATGSEMSNSCVISNEVTRQKYGCNGDYNKPLLSVVDPTLFSTLPKNQIGNGVADIMSHVMERYFSNTAHTEYSDALCEATLRTLVAFGPKVQADPGDYDAWCQVASAGTMAHNNVLGLGREQDWGCHKLEHELSARYDVAHGAGLAVIFPGWMRYVWRGNPGRFTAFATRVMGVAPQGSDEATVEAGVAALTRFFHSLGLPARLRDFGVDQSGVDEMARRAVTAEDGGERRVGFFKRLYEADCKAVYESVL